MSVNKAEVNTLYVKQVVDALLDVENARRATKYISEKLVISAARRVFKGKIDKRGNVEILIKIGKPNHKEREFIKRFKNDSLPKSVVINHLKK